MQIENKKVLVMGLAKSGLAAIKLLSLYNCDITLTEKKPVDAYLEELKKYHVRIEKQEIEVFERDYDFCVKNPGVPFLNSPYINALKNHNIPIITEIELAYQVMKPQHIIAITGTNGKTTTTTIVYEILRKAFNDKALVGGNIGTPLCDLVLENDLIHKDGYYIALEISNHQLLDIVDFKAEISTIINLTPDHLETMGSLDNYYKSKLRVYENSAKDDLFIFNDDDKLIKEYTDKYPINCNITHFSLETSSDVYLKEGYIIINNEKVMPIKNIKIVGKHNIQNVMIACIATKKLGVSNEIINEVVSSFNGVEHRIEFVKEVKGVRYYNDSKGTNTDATITALKAFEKNVILLVGGYEKGLAMDEMKKYLGCVKQVIGYGASGERIAKDLVDEKRIVVKDLFEATKKAYEIANEGDVVLLSPTTSSFDQYTCYEERGEHFKQIVNNL